MRPKAFFVDSDSAEAYLLGDQTLDQLSGLLLGGFSFAVRSFSLPHSCSAKANERGGAFPDRSFRDLFKYSAIRSLSSSSWD